MRRLAVGLGALLISTCPAAAQPAPREIAFVANAEDGTVSLIDVAARTVLGTLDINPAHVRINRPGAANYAQDTEISPDGRTLYVSRGYLGDVAAFDIAARRLLWTRSLDTPRSDHMTVSRDGRTIFVSALVDNRVYRIDTASGQITGHVVTGVWPHDTKLSKDGRRLYNSSEGEIASLGVHGEPHPEDRPGYAFQLTIADAASLQVRERIKLDTPFRPWAFAPGEKSIYAQLSNQRAVVTYDLRRKKIVRRLELPWTPGTAIADWEFEAPHHGLALTPDGRTLCLAGRESNYVALVRAPQLSLITTVKVGKAPGWAEIGDRGRVCLVSNARSNDVSFVSIRAGTEVARIPVGKGPKHIRVADVPNEVVAAFETGAKS
jgi:DNA-binding beta-propeller fold protein YncE